ncbi:uncharacterized protein TM35_000651190 [Trypanosoma theileri]|uniref:Uncharacterized protein n=1 Tax=Trypanosoma theileri TaxID=67003 RepID=A0A1X0NFX7_9TRYP|nr:uncharacterized protein TM35_000651190 [Trypanosoma theileri]ORC83557.1 hypothetical protein TM35_000651190 [Trypanosoma theileri]
MVHSAEYGRTRNTRKRTYYAPVGVVSGVPFPAPPPGVNFQFCECRAFPASVLYWASLRWYWGTFFAHKLTLVGFGLCRPGGSPPPSVTTLASWWCRGGVAVFWPKQAASTIVAPLLFWRSIGFYSSFGRS